MDQYTKNAVRELLALEAHEAIPEAVINLHARVMQLHRLRGGQAHLSRETLALLVAVAEVINPPKPVASKTLGRATITHEGVATEVVVLSRAFGKIKVQLPDGSTRQLPKAEVQMLEPSLA